MRILHAVPTGSWYGSEVMAAAFAYRQAQQHEVTILWRVGPGFPASAVRTRVADNVELLAVPAHLRSPEEHAAWYASQGRPRPDIIHAHLGPGARVARLISRREIPWVGSLHIRFLWSHFHDSDGVVAIAPWQLRDIPKRYRGLRTVALNFIEPPTPPEPRVIESFRRRAHANDDTFVIGVIGRLHLDKGLDLLCDAFIAANLPNARLLLVGEGPERPRLQRLAQGNPNIILTGYVPNASRALPAMDLYVSPSRSEPFGMTLLEAMHHGLPIVATATLGATDILGASQQLLPIGDIDALAGALTDAYQARTKRVAYDLEPFSPARSIAQIQELYEEAIAKRATSARRAHV